MTFTHDESGAVTVDWVVLTAGLVGLGLATMSVVSSGVEDLVGDVDAEMSRENNAPIIRTAFATAGWFDFDGETLTGLNIYNSGATLQSSDTLGSVSGSNAIVITTNPNDAPGGAHAGGLRVALDESTFEAGTTYRASFWARSETGTVDVRMFDTTPGGAAGQIRNLDESLTVDSEWTYVEYEFTGQEFQEQLYVSVNDPGVTFAVDDLKVEQLSR